MVGKWKVDKEYIWGDKRREKNIRYSQAQEKIIYRTPVELKACVKYPFNGRN